MYKHTKTSNRIHFSTFWLMLAMNALNLFVMHYYILFTASMDDENNFTRFIDNIFGTVIDVVVVTLIAYIITRRSLKATATITFLVTLFWSFSNVLYSRFFHHYLSLSAITQGDSLFDSFMIKCLISGLRWEDWFFVVSFVLFLFLAKKDTCPIKRPINTILSVFLVCLIIDLLGYIVFCSLSSERRYISFFIERIEARHFSNSLQLCNPNVASFRRGSVRTLVTEFVTNLQGPTELNEKQKAEINNFIKKQKTIHTHSRKLDKPTNVIFIIIESYMSFVSDMKVNGKEVTPFLNRLKRDSCTYYNGRVNKNVTIGESSDGQFIYMTGLLPLRSIVTISQARKNDLPPSLPQLLGYKSRMIIPTVETMWRQDEMCRQYGFDSLYTSKDYTQGYNSILNDEQIFKLAMQIDKTSQNPFFSVILTMSMHQPYDEQIDSSFPISKKSVRKDLASYLNKCHYTDKQLEIYFEHLKHSKLLGNSLIVLVADHPVLSTDFGGVRDYIPLYIIHPQRWSFDMWDGECNQIDVFSTLVDLLCEDSQWYGMGRSLRLPKYESTISEKTWEMSEQIIMSDFFLQREQ